MIKNYLKKYIYKFPKFQKFFFNFKKKYFYGNPEFLGWGMSTHALPPWIDNHNDEFLKSFLKNDRLLRKKIQNNEFIVQIWDDHDDRMLVMDTLMWRHYVISWCAHNVIQKKSDKNFVIAECGVGSGLSAFFISSFFSNYKYEINLFDAWEKLDEKNLTEYEKTKMDWYDYLNIDITKKNLKNFSHNSKYIKGHIPQSFATLNFENTIDLLHIDMNSANASKMSLEYFYPKLNKGGIILFDDYGWKYREETKKNIDDFFSNKRGYFFPLPTGQAFYINN